MVSTTNYIAAIELGSSKIVGAIGTKNSDGSIQLLAYAKEESSSFVRKGVVFNLDKTALSLTSIINKLETATESTIAQVYVSIGGQSLHTEPHTVVRNLNEETIITDELIDAIADENHNVTVEHMEILDVVPQEYKVGNAVSTEPIGVPTDYIEGRFLNVMARNTIKKNLERCFDSAKVTIADDVLVSPIVTARAVLTESEMRSGCALVDIGAETTTVCVYRGGLLRFMTVIPLGGNTITRDIATLNIEEQEAEKIKLLFGDAAYKQEGETPAVIETEDSHAKIDLAVLNEAIEARLEEIIANAWHQVEQSGYANMILSGIVLTGGVSVTKHLDELVRRKTNTEKVRIARMPHFAIKEAHFLGISEDGALNTLFGLLSEGTANCNAYVPPIATPPPGELFAEEETVVKPEPAKKKETNKAKERPSVPAEPKKGWKDRIAEFTGKLFDDDKL